MSDRKAGENCTLCGTTLSESAIETESGDRFCSSGCRDVDAAFGASSDGTDSDRPSESDFASKATDDDTLTRTFFRIDGMHSAMCESFLTSIADARDGVFGAEASYVTESIRVDHDPNRLSSAELENVLSTVGYTAYRREEAPSANTTDDSTGGTRRSREIAGVRKRRTDDLLEIRYVIGIVFGSFLLVPYAAIFYPVYLSSFTDRGMLHLYEDAFTSLDGLVFLPVFFVLTGAVLYLTGMPLLRGAYVSLKLKRPNTHLLAALTVVSAYGYGTLAFLTGANDIYYDLTIVVAAVVMAAMFYETMVKRRAMDHLTELTISQVEDARVLDSDGTTTTVPVEALESGDRILVRQGERIPVDGVLLESSCTVDEAVLTGESLPVSKGDGDAVIGGSVVTSNAAVVSVGDRTTSSIDRLTETVWNLQSADHGIQRRADELAVWITPIVLFGAVVVAGVHVALGVSTLAVVMVALLTIIVSSPWALGFATPISVATSIRAALAHGIVVFDDTVFERLRDVDVVVFDKTGTLTTGTTTVLEADGSAELLRAVAALERRGSHPVGDAIVAAFGEPGPTRSDGGFDSETESGALQVRNFESHATGVEGTVDGESVLVGHPDLFRERGWSLESALEDRVERARGVGRLPVVAGRDGTAEGVIVVGDEPRSNWEDAITGLSETGVEIVVLTGDDDAATDVFDDHPHIDTVIAGVPPDGKVAAIRRLHADRRVAMVGDGTNDAPALAEADLGISIGSGTALASDAADLAIIDDDLEAVERAFAVSAGAGRRVRQNLGLALVYNALVIPLAVIGLLNPLFATAAVAVSCLLIVGNSSRALTGE